MFCMSNKFFDNKEIQIALRKLRHPYNLSKTEIEKAINTVISNMGVSEEESKKILNKLSRQIKE